MRQKENDLLRAAFEWIPQEKKPRDKLRKRWLGGLKENLRELGVENWEDLVQDGNRWHKIVVAVKNLRAIPEKKEELSCPAFI